MSSTKLFRLSGISLLLGAVVSVIAGLMTLFLDISLTASPSSLPATGWRTRRCVGTHRCVTRGAGQLSGNGNYCLLRLYHAVACCKSTESHQCWVSIESGSLRYKCNSVGYHRASSAGDRCHTGEGVSTVRRYPTHCFGGPQPVDNLLRRAVHAHWLGGYRLRSDCLWLGWHDPDSTAERCRSRSFLSFSRSTSLSQCLTVRNTLEPLGTLVRVFVLATPTCNSLAPCLASSLGRVVIGQRVGNGLLFSTSLCMLLSRGKSNLSAKYTRTARGDLDEYGTIDTQRSLWFDLCKERADA